MIRFYLHVRVSQAPFYALFYHQHAVHLWKSLLFKESDALNSVGKLEKILLWFTAALEI